jgi:hypothetical protein
MQDNQDLLAASSASLQLDGDCLGATVQVAVRQPLFLCLAVDKEAEGRVIWLMLPSPPRDVDQRPQSGW